MTSGWDIETVSLGAFHLAGLEIRARWQDLHSAVPAGWHSLFERLPDATRFLEVSIEVLDGTYSELIGAVWAKSEPLPEGLRLLHVPANRWLHHVHEGPVTDVANGFDRLYTHAREAGLTVGDLKLDFGYTPAGDEVRHDLYLAIEPAERPQWIK